MKFIKSYSKIFTATLALSIIFTFQHTEANDKIKPGEIWPDNNGVHINAHGGGILQYNNSFYWFGEFKTSGKNGSKALHGVSCYSSNDLINWKNEGIVLKVDDDPLSEITKGCVMERPKVIYNEKTKKFVLWFHLEFKDKGYSSARTGLAVSDNITGPYEYIKSVRPNAKQWPIGMQDEYKLRNYNNNLEWWTPEWKEEVKKGLFVKRDFENGQMSRDMTLFVDDDGTAYHIHSSEENLTLHISELTEDYTDFTGKWVRVEPTGHNEAPAIFKYHGKYYLITSGCTGWKPNAARSFVADSIWGPWYPLGNPCIGENAGLTFYSQSTYILDIGHKGETFIFMADRWMPKNHEDGRYIWLPVKIENNKPVIEWMDEWALPLNYQFSNK